jgi:glycerol-3-phosphate acyltransferase PlsY
MLSVSLFWSVCVVTLAYMLGSLSFAVIVSRAMGLSDPRTYGSGNPGATNVLRSGNRHAAILTLALDALKGYVAVLATMWLAHLVPELGLGRGTVAAAGLAAFVGHLWPVFFRFEGGKGVATAAGVLLALNPFLGAVSLLTWLAVAIFTRYSSLAAIFTAVLAPVYDAVFWGPSLRTLAVAVMSALLIWRHKENIRKLRAGTESKLGQKSAPPAP